MNRKFLILACAIALTGSCMPIINISTGEIVTPESLLKMHPEMKNNSINNSNSEEVREEPKHYNNWQEFIHDTVLDLEIKLKNMKKEILSCPTETVLDLETKLKNMKKGIPSCPTKHEALIFGYKMLEDFYEGLLEADKLCQNSNKN